MLLDLIRRTRSYRRFREERRLDENDLRYLADCARLSPSARNLQVLRYRLVHQPEECEKLFARLRWAGYLKDWGGPLPGERPAGYIIMLLPREAGQSQILDAGIAAQSILLAATDRNWGGCMLGSVDKGSVHKEFSLPEELEIILVIALGVPAEQVVLEETKAPEAIEYWRDAAGIHHVPKLPLADIIIT